MTTLVAAGPEAPAKDEAPVDNSPARRRKGSGMNRKPRFAIAVTVVFFVLLYLPIFAVVLFSFNNKKSLTVFEGWSLRWYEAFFNDAELTKSLQTSLVVAAVAMVGSVAIGVLLAFGLVRARSRLGGAAPVARAERPLAAVHDAAGPRRAADRPATGPLHEVLRARQRHHADPAHHAGDRHRCRFAHVVQGRRAPAVPDHIDARPDDVLDLLRHGDPAGPCRRTQPGGRGGCDGPRRHPVAVTASGDAAGVVAGRVAITVASRCAACASASSPSRASCRA